MSTMRHNAGAIQALYRVFIQPTLSITPPRTKQSISRANKHTSRLQQRIPHSRRSFSSSACRQVKTREPETRSELWDEEIKAQRIYLIDPETNQLYKDPITEELEPPRTRYDVLNRLDRNTHRLVQFPNQEGEGEPGFIPVCKIVNKKEVYQQGQRRKQQAKERKKTEAASKTLKTLELNWAIDPNDLGHRLDKVADFLREGRKVEIILASKKKGKKANSEQCEEVLQRIRKTVDSVPGSKELKGMEGKLGGFCVLSYQGKLQQSQAAEGG